MSALPSQVVVHQVVKCAVELRVGVEQHAFKAAHLRVELGKPSAKAAHVNPVRRGLIGDPMLCRRERRPSRLGKGFDRRTVVGDFFAQVRGDERLILMLVNIENWRLFDR